MKGLFIICLVLCISAQGGLGGRHSISTNLCQPCAGCIEVTRPVMRLPNIHLGDICQSINNFNNTIANIRYNVRIQLYRLVSDIFDGDITSQERAYLRRQTGQCSFGSATGDTPTGKSQLSVIYDKLVSLHLALNFTESRHPWNRACSFTISGMTDDLTRAMCDLHFMIRGSAQTEGFDSVCQKDRCFHLRRGCVSFQEHSYMILRYAGEVLDSVSHEIEHLLEEWGC